MAHVLEINVNQGIQQVAPRTGRRVVSNLPGAGILASGGVKSLLRFDFPAKLVPEMRNFRGLIRQSPFGI